MTKTAIISHDSMHSYTGTAVPTDYKFVCWLGDVNENEKIKSEQEMGREIFVLSIPETDME